MNYKYKTAVLFVILMVGMPHHSNAQFWKRWGHKDEPRRRPAQKSRPKDKAKSATEPVAIKRQTVTYPLTQFKSRYRIDILVPLYLNELVKGGKPTYKSKPPEKALAGIEFYEGVKLALDTLDEMNYNLDVYVHDITEVTDNPESLVYGDQLDSSDLIIGAVQSKDIPVIAKFAAKKHINFISALSPSDAGIKNNPYFTITQPMLQSHCEWIKNYIQKKYGKKKAVILYRNSVAADESALDIFIKSDSLAFKKFNVNSVINREKLAMLVDSNATNALIISSLDIAYSENLLHQLDSLFPGYKFDVYGMPNWKSMGILRKANMYPNITINITSPYYYESSATVSQCLEKAYKKEFSGKTTELVYRGYETLFKYANLLHEQGVVFNKHVNSIKAPFTNYMIELKWNKAGDFLYNENQHLYLYSFTNGTYIISE